MDKLDELVTGLHKLSEKYLNQAHVLGLEDGAEEYFPDIDAAMEEGESQAYYKVYRDIEELIKKYGDDN